MNGATTVTGIPIEYLFLIIGALVSLLYMDLRRGFSTLNKNGEKRDRLLVRICTKLGISWNDD
jgi:hypothetical protein